MPLTNRSRGFARTPWPLKSSWFVVLKAAWPMTSHRRIPGYKGMVSKSEWPMLRKYCKNVWENQGEDHQCLKLSLQYSCDSYKPGLGIIPWATEPFPTKTSSPLKPFMQTSVVSLRSTAQSTPCLARCRHWPSCQVSVASMLRDVMP